MGLIIRTAGENRTKTEIKRDYEYLLRMWDTVRELTLKSNAPACVYEEGDLIKRAIRDLYNKDVVEIVVEGDEGYRNAKDFMRMLMPSHAKNVKQYREAIPLFQRHHVEAQLDVMFSPTVTLRSGGYIVINQTEALVAIDVNSGRATREHSIEDTAYKTNLEAADEIARQLRLRDLAGLIVIDFIDMEDNRNDRNVEKRLRDSVKNDRARVQIGKISQFGLLEMSRQRLRAGVVAGSTVPCPNCGGQGIVRSVESTALRVLRSLEEEGQRQRAAAVTVRAPLDVAIYTLNQKRRELTRIESEYGMAVQFDSKDRIIAGTFEIDRVEQKAPEDRVKHMLQNAPLPAAEIVEAEADASELVEEEDEGREESAHEETQETQQQQPQSEGKRKRRRRRRGRDHLGSTGSTAVIREPVPTSALGSSAYREGVSEVPSDETEIIAGSNLAPAQSGSHSFERPPGETSGRKRRRRRRGRRGPRDGQNPAQAMNGPVSPNEDTSPPGKPHGAPSASVENAVVELPSVIPNAPSDPVWSLSPEADVPEPEHHNRHVDHSSATDSVGARPTNFDGVSGSPVETAEEKESVAEADIRVPQETRGPAQPPRRGWWQRPFRARD
jgi:ribonuclease E